jgi:NhaA family Na+:H+ antiporter
MSIFITKLAFPGQAGHVTASKIAILLASLTAGVFGFLWLRFFGRPVPSVTDPDTMDYPEDRPERVLR